MPARPVIGITTALKPTRIGSVHATGTVYTSGLGRYCDVVPILLPGLDEGQVSGGPLAFLPLVDGLLFTGAAANVHPDIYGQPETEEHKPFDHQRDATALPLMRAALDLDMPILAICRGFQEMNVACGGTLHPAIHTIEGRDDHRELDSDDAELVFAPRHSVSFSPDGLLRKWLGADTAQVNSLHRQGIDRLGDGLRIEATASDGTIEAVSHPDRQFVIGLQWHAEYQPQDNIVSEKLFARFEQAAENYKKGKVLG